MLVKCRSCGKKIDRKIAYKVAVNSKNEYYCNEEEYSSKLKKEKMKKDIYENIASIFGTKIRYWSVFTKSISEVEAMYGLEKINEYIIENEDFLCRVMNKTFQSEFAQIKYFMAILRNNLKDYQVKTIPIREIRVVEYEMPEMKYTPRQPRKALIEYEQD